MSKKLKSFQIGFLNLTMGPFITVNSVTRSQPIEHLWDVVEWELCTLDVHPTNLYQLEDAILSIFLKNALSTLLNQCHVELSHVLKAK